MLLAFATGGLLRLGLALPAHALRAESDAVVAGLVALEVLNGEMPAFNVGFRNGALSGYLLAALFWLFGPSRATLALGPFLVGCVTMWLWYRLAQRVVDPVTARVALAFIAVPGGAYLYWTSLPNTYPESMLLCASILLLAIRADASRDNARADWSCGFAAGLGFWNSPLTLSCSLPAALWVLYRDPSRLTRPRQVLAALSGAFLGALPWILFNVLHGFPSLHRNFAARPFGGFGDLLESIVRLAVYRIPGLLAQTETVIRPAEMARLSWLTWPVLILHLVAIWVFLRMYLARTEPSDGPAGQAPGVRLHQPVAGLFVMVTIITLLLNVASYAGRVPGPTSRYLLPIYLLVPAALALLVRHLASRSRALAAFVVAALLAFHVVGAYLPWTDFRHSRQQQIEYDDALVERLRQEGVDAVLGDFWVVYPLNFHTEMEILGVPLIPGADHRKVARHLKNDQVRWALVAKSKNRKRFRHVLDVAGLDGRLIEIQPHYDVFLVDETQEAEAFRRRVRKAAGGKGF